MKLDRLNLATGRLHESIRQLNVITWSIFDSFKQVGFKMWRLNLAM